VEAGGEGSKRVVGVGVSAGVSVGCREGEG
jgi:hypothetical protein